jgi:hypothetical protein
MLLNYLRVACSCFFFILMEVEIASQVSIGNLEIEFQLMSEVDYCTHVMESVNKFINRIIKNKIKNDIQLIDS